MDTERVFGRIHTVKNVAATDQIWNETKINLAYPRLIFASRPTAREFHPCPTVPWLQIDRFDCPTTTQHFEALIRLTQGVFRNSKTVADFLRQRSWFRHR